MTQEEQYKATLGRYLPAPSVTLIFNFLNGHSVHFHITRQRTSKLGDYRMPQPRHDYHEISVNGDLGPNMFLLVLLHEMAHLEVFIQYGKRVQPHGHEWQEVYRHLLLQYFRAGCFPPETTPLFVKYTASVPLNRAAGDALERELKSIDSPDGAPKELLLCDLPIGSRFRLKNGKELLLRSVEKRRTRYRCADENSRQNYLVSGNAAVILVPE